jgi:DnaJ-class molecular chaperone
MSLPSICPVCRGRGFVSSEFYANHPGTCTGVWDVTCKACNGKGIVWPEPPRKFSSGNIVVEPVFSIDAHAN